MSSPRVLLVLVNSSTTPAAVTVKLSTVAAAQLGQHRLSFKFFTINGDNVTAGADVWASVAELHYDPIAQLPKQLGHVVSALGIPQQQHLARKAAVAIA